ncbi:hypothetical protein [Duganella sp. LjRoot269]|uniref:hypothetical protein n=1 Tax=Duganella sp. LjRoot269 TaxID=3342305 RepID=UPI003ECEAEA0
MKAACTRTVCRSYRQIETVLDRVEQSVSRFGDIPEHTVDMAELNIGDYSGMNNVGGQFPLGEVFTEARYHVDVFAVTEAVYLDDEPVHRDGAWQVAAA